MDELYQRVATLEEDHRNMKTSIIELQDRRRHDGQMIREIHQDVKVVKEIVAAWNNMQGFVKTIKALSSVAWVVLKVLGFIAALMLALTIFAKTGKWGWPGG